MFEVNDFKGSNDMIESTELVLSNTPSGCEKTFVERLSQHTDVNLAHGANNTYYGTTAHGFDSSTEKMNKLFISFSYRYLTKAQVPALEPSQRVQKLLRVLAQVIVYITNFTNTQSTYVTCPNHRIKI